MRRRVLVSLLVPAVLLGVVPGLVTVADAAPKSGSALGVPVPGGAKRLGPNLFRSPLGYPATIRWIERRLSSKGKAVRFRSVIDLPEVVASHAEAPGPKTKWSGVNVSRYGGSVKVFIIERR